MKKFIILILTIVLSVSCSKKDDATIIGTASADNGNVLSGITVKLYSESTTLLEDTQTDSQGNFKFSGLESGNYYIGATITVNGTVWDTGNRPRIVYVGDEIVEEVALTLTQK
ncbi:MULTISPECIES: SdrD B-like domain-containing protein [Aestuariivivens]|uniref:carboxypeptidase regulatory-like domain-containing protein n=1 Tax=Aestuariivivens TaxID=1820275 RepID=UPI001CBFB646|nr:MULTISPECIES: SdrD B-like domain-containing protein [Aestuariivivens]